MAIYISAIYSMTNIKTIAHIFFQTSFSQRYVDIEKGHNSASTHQTEKEKKYRSAYFHKQLIYETSKLFRICFISSVSSLRGTYTNTKNSSLGHVVQGWTISKTNKEHNSVKIKKRHNNIFSTERILVS